MKRFFLIVLCFVLCSSAVFADDSSNISDNTDIIDIDNSSVYNDTTNNLLQQIVDKLPETSDNGLISVEPRQNVELRQLRVSSGETSGLHSIFLSLIGDYNPIVKDYTYTSPSGYTQHAIEILPDWSWLASALLFIVVLYCTFRFLGGIFHG